jgi:class 3 adenylate cyclase/CHAT domain-containing protein
MTDDKRKPTPDSAPAREDAAPVKEMHASVDAILQERLRLEQEQAALDQMIKDKFQRNITVLFTDIKGSTAYFETYGDVEGRAMVQRHNAMLFPPIEQHHGKIIKTIGDAIMATFDSPAEGVKAAIDMQKVLADFNVRSDQKHRRINVRMGLNFGPAVVEEKDVFGDAVNVAARVEAKADAEEILISADLYKEIRSDDEIQVRFFGDVECKGKSEPVKVYRVIWSENQLVAEGEFKKATTRRTVDKRGRVVRGRVVELTASREGSSVKISVNEHQHGEEKTVSQYDLVKYNEEVIKQQCDEIVGLLNRSNKRGKVTKEILKQLKSAGQILFDQLLSQEAKEKIMSSQAEHLTLHLDDNLVHVPWELLFDGQFFFCQRFGMGRIVATRQRIADVPDRNIARPLRMLVIADPRSDLPAASTEGAHIRDALEKEYEFINVNLKAQDVPVNYIKSKLRNFDIIHYAGHADYDAADPSNSGWLLADGKVSSNDFKSMAGNKPMPALVFANACQSGQTDEWKLASGYETNIFGLANAFLLTGVQHYIGTFWDILDDPGHDFALAFYQAMIAGKSVGESVRKARLALIDKYGEETIVWASYMLYGDPTFSYLEDVAAAGESTDEVAAPSPDQDAAPAQPAVFRGADAAAARQPKMLSNKLMLGAVAAIAAVVLVVVLAMKFMGGGAEKDLAAAYSKLEGKDYPGAIAAFEKLSSNAKTRPQANKGLAATYNLMGLAASEKGEKDKSVEYYQKAYEADKKSSDAAINLGQAYLSMGKTAEAEEAFKGAVSSDPNNSVASTLLAQAAAMMANQQDKEKQAEISAMTTELVDRWKSGKIPAPPKNADEWTSHPVTITFLDFDQKGAVTMEGEMDFLKIALAQAINETGRVTVVEREKIDKILSELNLSALTDNATRVQIGKLFGAKLIATGSFIRAKGDAQVNLQLIETETSTVPIAVTETYSGDPKAGELAKKVAETLVKKVLDQYPIQAKITEISGDEVKLNLGAKAGVKQGMKLDLLDADLTKVGAIEITSAGPEVSKAKVIEKPEKLAVGAKVKEVRQ